MAAAPGAAFLSLDEVELLAKEKMTKMAFDYFASGAETQSTVADNRHAFAQYRILPRILIDVSMVDTSCTMFGGCTLSLACLSCSLLVVVVGVVMLPPLPLQATRCPCQ